MDKYNSKLEKNKQDLLRVTKLSQESLDGLKYSYWEFTEPVYEGYKDIKGVVWETFLKVLLIESQEKVSFNEVKNKMSAFQSTEIKSADIDQLCLIYNNKESLKQNKPGQLLVDWMSFALEYKIYRKKMQDLKSKQPKIAEKIQRRLKKISKFSKTKKNLQKNLSDLENYLKFQSISLESSSLSVSVKGKNSSFSHSNSKTIEKISDFPDMQVTTNDNFKETTELRSFQRIPFKFEREQELKCCNLRYFCC